MRLELGPRRGQYCDISKELCHARVSFSDDELGHFEAFDLIYRSLCAVLYNYVPQSGHPGGSISSGRMVSSLLFASMDYDASDPDRDDADIISYAAGHKALGLYAMWALRNEVLRIAAPGLLPEDRRYQLRLEDLLGFRRNPVTATPLYKAFGAKPLDGHPTPATPFLRLSTGASGVGVASSLGLAWGARDTYGEHAPRVHIIEGEGGLTPGRVAEALAAAGTASLDNVVLHLDWNQASIDTDRVCREGETPGDYVQWNPMELFYLHDWNVIYVPDGRDFEKVLAAQSAAAACENHQPTVVVYRTVKGWHYGIEGRKSHGAGHKLCSDGYYTALAPLLGDSKVVLPSCCDQSVKLCEGADGPAVMEECFWQALRVVREELERRSATVEYLASRLKKSKQRLDARARKPRPGAPNVDRVFACATTSRAAGDQLAEVPPALKLKPGTGTTLRAELGRTLNHYNRESGGAIFVSAADLLASTSVSLIGDGLGEGYYNAVSNPESRLLSIGGICEDAMSGIASGLASYGRHIGVASSYGAFIAPLGHIAARLHAIGNQARQAVREEPYKTMFLVCAHAGLKTGEDGPTHADPQPLQLLQENFPPGTMITLTPWDPQEVWYLVSAALARRPAVIAPFVTRPSEPVLDRQALGLSPASAAQKGVYALRAARGKGEGTVVLQGSGVTMAFVTEVLPRLDEHGIDLHVYYVASTELFDTLPREEQRRIFPPERAQEAMGITGFTLPTMYRWIRSDRGLERTLYPYKRGHFLGSGQADKVLREAGLDGEGQFEAILRYMEEMVKV